MFPAGDGPGRAQVAPGADGLAQIEELEITIQQKAGEKGKLYGSVTSMDLADAMAEKGVEVDRRRIKLAEPIKALGDYQVPVKLHSDVTASLSVSVQAAE